MNEQASSFASQVGRMVKHLEHLEPGDLAQLRRLDPSDPSAPAFWKLMSAHDDHLLPTGHGPAREAAERRWALFLGGAARLVGLHRPNRPLGRALAEADYSELRFSRLLRARGESLSHAVRTLAGYLASKGAAVDLVDLARLIVSEGRSDEESVRRRLARDYYAPSSSKGARS